MVKKDLNIYQEDQIAIFSRLQMAHQQWKSLTVWRPERLD
jgi:hypothetical protein